MSKYKIQSEERFGKWIVISNAEPQAAGNQRVLCRCDCSCGCNFISLVLSRNLVNGKSVACRPCSRDLCLEAGKKFGKRTVIGYARSENDKIKLNKRKDRLYQVICECGAVQEIAKQAVIYSKACSKKCLSDNWNKKYPKEYRAWGSAKNRCYNLKNKDYHKYGGRGIGMHEEWKNNFKAFFDHVGKKPSKDHSLNRINNNGNYEPGNVEWATPKDQSNNKRNVKIYKTKDGKSGSLTELSRMYNKSAWAVAARVRKYGWNIDEALNTPIGHNAKLDQAKARYILSSNKTNTALAKELGVSATTISHVRTGKTWGRATTDDAETLNSKKRKG